MDLFCETCEEMICRDCIVRVHRDHQYDLVRAAFPKHKDEIVASLQPVEQQLASVNKALDGMDTLCGTITDQRQALKTQVKSNMRQIHQALEAREEELIIQIDQMADQKLKNAAAQQDQMELVATRLKSCRDFVRESLKTGSPGEILNIKKGVVHQVQELTAEFKPEMLVAEEKANMRFNHTQKELIRTCHQFGKVVSLPLDPDHYQAEGEGLHIAVLGETATATVHLRTDEEKSCKSPVDIQCELVSRDGSSQVRGAVKQDGDKCKISYQPQCGGQHHLHIRAEGMDIARSPFTISAFTTTPTNTIAGLNKPWGVAVNDQSQVIVAERHKHCITIVNKNGDKRSFGTHGSGPGQMNQPVRVALTNTGGILVCNETSRTIQHFSFDGVLICYTEARGSGADQPYLCHGIAMHPHNTKIYVTDVSNHLIQILNADLTHSGSFGGLGSGNGQLNSPRGISFDSAGNVFVADWGNNRVQVFTAGGEYIRQFGKKGAGEGDLDRPACVAIDSNDIVYISEGGNHRISVFAPEGQFLRSFGTRGSGPGQFNLPTDVTVGKDGNIYVTDYNNGRIQVF